ncbi:MAG: hypothetical protein HY059_17775 [Proteobacteria bacterium]|nr:hypothetical protein [Pseudomonadota bacterium]
MRCVFNLVVWGRDYVRNFLELSLPTLLSKGNLRDFPWRATSRFSFMTTRADWADLQASPIFGRLRGEIDVVPGFIDDIVVDPSRPAYNHKYIRVSLAQFACIQADAHRSDCIFFLYPDFIYSTDAIVGVAQRMAAGADAVCCPIPFISEDAVAGGLFERENLLTRTLSGPVVSIPPWRLVDLQIRNPHPVVRGFDMDGSEYGEWPGYFSWRIGDAGSLLRCFHLHPMAIRSRPDDPDFLRPFELSLDDEYASRLFKPGDGILYPPDTDSFALCSLRPEAAPPHPQPGRRDDLLRAVRWAEAHASLLHRDFLDISYRWRRAPGEETLWSRAEARADAFVDRLRRRLDVPDSVLEYEDPETYRARRRRLGYFQQSPT